LREFVRAHRKLLADLAVPQNLHQFGRRSDKALFLQEIHGDLRARLEHVEGLDVQRLVGLAEDVREATLGGSPIEGHLTALEPDARLAGTGAGRLALATAAGGFAMP